ncbi:MAG: hypothetical protein QM753_11490 [Thermomicrobiales bacterium]
MISTRAGFSQQAVAETGDRGGHGGGEQQGLSCLGQARDDAGDVAGKPHVEHAVGLVEHQHLDLREVAMSLAHQIQQPARRGHQHIHPAAQRRHLG